MAEHLDWHVAVYASNEAARIASCIRSIAGAMGGRRFRITAMVNGSSDASATEALELGRGGLPLEVQVIDYGDKANAINQFLHHLRQPARFIAQVDAYAIVGAGTFHGMEDMFDRDEKVTATTGVAVTGRTMRAATAAALSVGGQLYGQLHSFRSSFVDRMVARGLRLPVGLYRGDGLLGSMAAHDLDPAQPWRNERIKSVADATFAIPVLSMFRPRDIRRQYRREIRVAQGRLENAAIKSLIHKGGYEALPAFACDMVADLLATGPLPPVSGRVRHFRRIALREMAAFQRPDPLSLLPRRVP